jgi:putative phosphoesterase
VLVYTRPLTTVAVISDTHLPRGARRLPAECLRRLERADLILHGGDFVTLAVLEELRELGRPVEGVYGNMDSAELRELLPREHVVEIAGARIGLVHIPGPRTGREERLARRFPGCSAVIYGHTHLPDLTRHGDVWMLNPGSPTERRRAPARSMIVLEVADGRIQAELIGLP